MSGWTKWAIWIGLAMLVASHASGQCLPNVCSVTLVLQSDANGITLGGSGTNSASISFGSLQAFGSSLPSGVSRTVGGTNWTLSTPFDVKVTCINFTTLLPCNLVMSQGYTLTAQLQSADTINIWRLSGISLTNASATTLTSSGTYSQAAAYTFALTIPFTESAGTINNTINLVATAN